MEKMPLIQVFALGGTIAMTPGTAGVVPSLDAKSLVDAVPSLTDIAEIQAETLAAVGSANLSFQQIYDVCRRAEAADCNGVVITQGTDTLEETSFLASLLYKGDKPLIFTGAMRTPNQPGADGPSNLYNAVLAAASGEVNGVSLLMNTEIHDPALVAKEHTAEVSAFVSRGFGPVARIIEGEVRTLRAIEPIADIEFCEPESVALVSAALDLEPVFIEKAPDLGFKGMVIEAFGAGHLPEAWADAAAELASEMPVVLSTRITEGPVLENSYGYKGAEIDLLNRGLLPSGYLKGRKARILLSLLLAENAGTAKARFIEAVRKLG
ncbi:asparaginase [Kordiimonas sp. 5E331]|nr:asparaginase [Kordiimonas laminariae]